MTGNEGRTTGPDASRPVLASIERFGLSPSFSVIRMSRARYREDEESRLRAPRVRFARND